MALTKQAKILSKKQIEQTLGHLESTRHPTRNKLMLLLSVRAGLRAIEISKLDWSMVTDIEGNITDDITLYNKASKGKSGGRSIPIAKQLIQLLNQHHHNSDDSLTQSHQPVIVSERGNRMSSQVIVDFFHRLYRNLDFNGASSHSGRRSFITAAARNIVQAGGSLKEVQELAGHSSLQITSGYIDTNKQAKKKVVNLLYE